MKKFSCLLLCLITIAAFAAAEADFSGEWYLNEVRFGAMTLTPSMFGRDVVLTLNADGTASMHSAEADGGEQTDTGTWSASDTGVLLTIEGSPIAFNVDESGNLVADISEEGDANSTCMVYGREKVETTLYTPAAEKAAADISDFDGVWTIHSIDLFGQIVPSNMYGYEVTLEISSGHMKIASGMFEDVIEREADGVFENGSLTFKFSDEDGESEMRLTLLEDGMLSDYEGSDDELGDLYYYFQKAE